MNYFYEHCKTNLIPDISDELVAQMKEQIKPVKRLKSGRFCLWDVSDVDARKTAYNWTEKYGRLLRLYRDGLNSKEIITFHNWGAPSLFKPSLAEVYGSIVRFVPDWSMIRYFWIDSSDLDRSNIIDDCHYARCVLFGDEEPLVIDETFDEMNNLWIGILEEKEDKPFGILSESIKQAVL